MYLSAHSKSLSSPAPRRHLDKGCVETAKWQAMRMPFEGTGGHAHARTRLLRVLTAWESTGKMMSEAIRKVNKE